METYKTFFSGNWQPDEQNHLAFLLATSLQTFAREWQMEVRTDTDGVRRFYARKQIQVGWAFHEETLDAFIDSLWERYQRELPRVGAIVLYPTWNGAGEKVTVRARVEHAYVEKQDHADLVLLELREGQQVHNVPYDRTGTHGWHWPEGEG